jgi:hypothetical protein
VIGALQQSLVQGLCSCKLSFADFKVNKRAPQNFRHVQLFLSTRQLVNSSVDENTNLFKKKFFLRAIKHKTYLALGASPTFASN